MKGCKGVRDTRVKVRYTCKKENSSKGEGGCGSELMKGETRQEK